MTNIAKTGNAAQHTAIADQAVYWFALLLDGSETAADRAAFARWISDPAHLAAFEDIERLWNGTASLDLAQRSTVGRRAFIGGGLAIAVLVAGWGTTRRHSFADLRTSVGERQNMTLPGGVDVVLASNTALSLRTQGGINGVHLHHGEAFFDMSASNTAFFVESGNGISQSFGGQIDVALYEGETTVIAARRSVDLRFGGMQGELKAGHAVRYRDGQRGKPYGVDVATSLAWREGRLIFMGQPLSDVVQVLERWQPGKIVIIGDALKARPVTLMIDLDRSATAVSALAQALPVRVDHFTDYLTVIRAA
ncbi:DUF4880 domain-containing protein [Thalassospira sp.]|uniref:FecR family protein n=1 Tax=Thalassospira sp. TaxID=1912094 RepID=UPI002734B28E|nr:DUF4880 domain-containing protein [Thalassospira sp.]MDP2699341.1 DUF4880 domain-containing protein [Thalassospira sp.]